MSAIRKRSFGIIPIALPGHGPPLFLILRAYRNWDFPKGQAEAGEAPLQTALRELAEETGIRSCTLAWGEVSMDTAPYSGGKVASYYPARVTAQTLTLPVNPELGRPEHDEYRWAPYAAARTLLPPRLAPPARLGAGPGRGRGIAPPGRATRVLHAANKAIPRLVYSVTGP